MGEERGDGRTALNTDSSNRRKVDEASGAAEKEWSISTVEAASDDARDAGAKHHPDEAQLDTHGGGVGSDKREDMGACRLGSQEWTFF